MNNNGFFHTKAGRLTLVFLVIMLAFFMITVSIYTGADALGETGFLIMVLAMLYSPVKVHILDKRKK